MVAFFGDVTQFKTQLGAVTDYQNNPEVLKKVASQFEALYLQMVLKSMRQASKVFDSEIFSGQALETYRDMHDQQLALEISQKGGLGIADVLYQQLSPASAKDHLRQMTKEKPGPYYPHSVQGGAGGAQNTVTTSASHQPRAAGFESPEAFMDTLWPAFKPIAEQAGLDPRILMAQAALETGWGKRSMTKLDGSEGFNYFGIKADENWTGEKVLANTTEFESGILNVVKAPFRVYQDPKDSAQDYVRLLHQHPRYQSVVAVKHSPKQFIQALGKSGYATDPQYGQKLWQVFNHPLIQNRRQ